MRQPAAEFSGLNLTKINLICWGMIVSLRADATTGRPNRKSLDERGAGH
jgi:hypothetical protein